MGAVVKYPFRLRNATSYSLDKYNGIFLARSEDKGLAILLKFLINLRYYPMCKKGMDALNTSWRRRFAIKSTLALSTQYPH